MPTHKTTDVTALTATGGGLHTAIRDSRFISGKLRYFEQLYTFTTGTDEADDDDILIMPIRKGMLFLPNTFKVVVEGSGFTAMELDIGEGDYADETADDPTKYCDGMPVPAAAGVYDVNPAGGFWLVGRGSHTMGGGAAAEAETVTGVAATDVVTATLIEDGANADLNLLFTELTANTVTYNFNEDPTAGAIVNYIVERAVAQQAEHRTSVEVAREGYLLATLKDINTPVAGQTITISGFYVAS